jgi:hypothetical protein
MKPHYNSTTTDYTFTPYTTLQPPEKLVSLPFGPPTSRTQAVLLLSPSHLSLYVRPVKSTNDVPRIITRVEFLIWCDGIEAASAVFERDEIIGFEGNGTGFGIPDFFALPYSCGLEGLDVSIRICQDIPLQHDIVSHRTLTNL